MVSNVTVRLLIREELNARPKEVAGLHSYVGRFESLRSVGHRPLFSFASSHSTGGWPRCRTGSSIPLTPASSMTTVVVMTPLAQVETASTLDRDRAPPDRTLICLGTE